MEKIVVLDLDGTLLNSNKEISEFTCGVIKKIKDNNKIVLASARGFTRIKPYLEELELLSSDNCTIAFNGSLVLTNEEKIIIDNEIDLDSKYYLDDFIKSYKNIDWFYYTYDGRVNYKDILDINTFIVNNKIYKVVCCASNDIINEIRNNISDHIRELFEISSSEEKRIEFVKKGSNKVKSIQILLEKLNKNRDDLIAIGDGENDIDMIKYAKIGIAMDNAPDSVKKIANIVTVSNDLDGVGKILEKILIDKKE